LIRRLSPGVVNTPCAVFSFLSVEVLPGPLLRFVHPRAVLRAVEPTLGLAFGARPNAFSLFGSMSFGPLLAFGVGAGETMFEFIVTSCRARGLKVDRLASFIDGLMCPGERVDLVLRGWGYGEGRERVRDRIRRSSAGNEWYVSSECARSACMPAG